MYLYIDVFLNFNHEGFGPWSCWGGKKLQISVPLAAIDALSFYVDFVKSSTPMYSLLLNSCGEKNCSTLSLHSSIS